MSNFRIIAIYPEHCHIWKKGCDGAYWIRRKVWVEDVDENPRNYIKLDGEQVFVKKIEPLTPFLTNENGYTSRVEYETYQEDTK